MISDIAQIKNAIAIINGTYLYHFNGLMVNKTGLQKAYELSETIVKVSYQKRWRNTGYQE